MNEVFVYDWLRSPRGRARPDGGLHGLSPHALLAQLCHGLAARSLPDAAIVDELVLGCVTQHGEQAGNLAKTAAAFAGWPDAVAGITLNRFCSSGLDAIDLAALKIAAGQARCVVAGGIEMMSRVPMLADRAAVFLDPALARASRVLMMGNGADLLATLCGATRRDCDAVALQSQQRAAAAREQGWFRSVVPVHDGAGGPAATHDECIRPQTTAASLAAMPAAFGADPDTDARQRAEHPQITAIDHVHTAGNSPAMADGAALLLLGDREAGERLGLRPRARIVAAATACDDPMQVVGGCIAASRALLQRRGLQGADVDLWELHEAFAATVVRARRELDIPDDRLNVLGGAIALGHPMGATGAVLAGTLLDELERRGLHRGLAAASGAAGSGTAMLFERL